MKEIVRSSKGLVDALFEEFDALRDGKSTPQNARAKASIANTICQVTRLEMEYSRFVSDARTAEEKIGGVSALPALQMGAAASA